MRNTPASALISATQLHGLLGRDDIVIIDGTWHMPNLKRDARTEYDTCHIPNAVFLDLDACSDPNAPNPHSLASAEHFEQYARTVGINNDSHVIVYDSYGLFSAARFWWMFHYYGLPRVQVLDGGLRAWQANGFATSARTVSTSRYGNFTAIPNLAMVIGFDELHANPQDLQVIDARSDQRFCGNAPEPRPGLPSGHMPNALNMPFDQLLACDGTMLGAQDQPQIFRDVIDADHKPIVYSCGSGVTACILALAHSVNNNTDTPLENTRLYDGSWSEWAAHKDTKKLTGSTIAVKTWHLSHKKRPQHEPTKLPDGYAIQEFPDPAPEILKRLYDSVGGNNFWYERRAWQVQDYHDYCVHTGTHTILLSHKDDDARYNDAGYAEIIYALDTTTIAYFGLCPQYVGRGLGKILLEQILALVWQHPNTQSVYLTTCDHDHPHALQNYRKRGFQSDRIEFSVIENPL